MLSSHDDKKVNRVVKEYKGRERERRKKGSDREKREKKKGEREQSDRESGEQERKKR